MNEILNAFGIHAPVLSQEQLSGGRIHGTFRVRTAQKIAEDVRAFNPTAAIGFTVGNQPIDPAVWAPILAE